MGSPGRAEEQEFTRERGSGSRVHIAVVFSCNVFWQEVVDGVHTT